MSTPRVLITGGEGSLASVLQHQLAASYTLFPLSRSTCPIDDKEKLQEAIEDIRPHILINCAAYNAVDLCETNEEEQQRAYAINTLGPKYLAELSAQRGIPLVHFSTDYVFDGMASDGYRENVETSPINYYGETKAKGEEYIQSTTDKYYIIRTSWLFGPQGRGVSTKKSFVDIVQTLAAKNPELTLVDDEYSSPTFTQDLATFTKALLDEKQPHGIYHGVNSGHANWLEYGTEILRILDIPRTILPISGASFQRPAKRPHRSYLINTQGPTLRSWQEALHEFLIS